MLNDARGATATSQRPVMDILWNETSNTTPLLRLVATRTNVDSYPYHTLSHGPDLIIAAPLFSQEFTSTFDRTIEYIDMTARN